MRTPEAVATLTEIVRVTPNHASTDLLMKYVNNENPRHLSVTGLLHAVFDCGRHAFEIMDGFTPDSASREDPKTMNESAKQLNKLRSKTHPDIEDIRVAMANYATLGNSLVSAKQPSDRLIERYNRSITRLENAYQEVSQDAETIEAVMCGSY